MGPQFIVSSEGLEKSRIKPATPGLQVAYPLLHRGVFTVSTGCFLLVAI